MMTRVTGWRLCHPAITAFASDAAAIPAGASLAAENTLASLPAAAAGPPTLATWSSAQPATRPDSTDGRDGLLQRPHR